MPTAKRIPNMFAFYGQENEKEKIVAQYIAFKTGSLCATDAHGNPQAFFRLPVIPKKRVLGSLKNEGMLEHKPTLLLAAPRQ